MFHAPHPSGQGSPCFHGTATNASLPVCHSSIKILSTFFKTWSKKEHIRCLEESGIWSEGSERSPIYSRSRRRVPVNCVLLPTVSYGSRGASSQAKGFLTQNPSAHSFYFAAAEPASFSLVAGESLGASSPPTPAPPQPSTHHEFGSEWLSHFHLPSVCLSWSLPTKRHVGRLLSD